MFDKLFNKVEDALNEIIKKWKAIKVGDFKMMNAGLDLDGSCGPKTVEAVKAFQKKYGLAVDGSFGSASRGKMTSLLSAQGWS